MMRSLFSGVSGLKVHQTKMDVIANNISNVNTIGYKSSRVTFNEVFYQRIQGASGANADTGRAGTNPMQIGLGASVASIDNLMSQGASQRTDNSTDVMVQGNGFFIVSDVTGTYFTRAGNIAKDASGNLHINGMQLMGWDTIKDPTTGKNVIQSGPVKPISLSGEKEYVTPAATTIVDVKGNLNANEDKVVTRTMEIYDSVGNMYTIDVKFTYHPSYAFDSSATLPASSGGGTGAYVDKNGIALDPQPTEPVSNNIYSYWDFEFMGDKGLVNAYPDNDRENKKSIALNVSDLAGDISIDSNGVISTGGTTGTGSTLNKKGTLCYNTDGELIAYGPYDPSYTYETIDTTKAPKSLIPLSQTSTTPPRINLLMAPIDVLDPTATFGEPGSAGNIVYASGSGTAQKQIGTVFLDFSSLTQFAGEHTNTQMYYVDGNAPGTLQDISIDTSGKITGRYSNGQTKLLAQIPLAQFTNPAGLEKVGGSLYAATANSGQFDGAGEVGSVMGGALEMSNVDLSQEFTEMITTQRGFQANSRIISTSDEMLQELVNLKR